MPETIKTIIYSSISKEDLYEKGVEIGLDEDALAFFIHFGNEIALEIELEKKTGKVINCKTR